MKNVIIKKITREKERLSKGIAIITMPVEVAQTLSPFDLSKKYV